MEQNDEESVDQLMVEQETIKAANITVDALIDKLISEAAPPDDEYLMVLSDLSRPEMQLMRDHWTAIPVDRRRFVIQRLVDMSDEQLDLHLGRLLRIALDDDDAEVRQSAIGGLWEEVSGDVGGQLIHMMMDDSVIDVRIEAANALGPYILAGELDELDSSLAIRAQESLLDLLHDPNEPLEIRCRALESVAYSSEMGVRQLIEDAYYDADEDMRISSLIAMGRSADARWRGYIRAELQNPSSMMRAQAAIAAGELEARAALEDILILLQDVEKDVRLAAIFALGRLGGDAATEALNKIVEEASDPDETEAAEEALEDVTFYGDSEAIPLFDEEEEEIDEWDLDFRESWYDRNDDDLGEYE